MNSVLGLRYGPPVDSAIRARANFAPIRALFCHLRSRLIEASDNNMGAAAAAFPGVTGPSVLEKHYLG
jgi:hypothetical protein